MPVAWQEQSKAPGSSCRGRPPSEPRQKLLFQMYTADLSHKKFVNYTQIRLLFYTHHFSKKILNKSPKVNISIEAIAGFNPLQLI
jgi:hypothetical protein